VAELLNAWAPRIARAILLPSSGGRFEVTLDGEPLFSKVANKRHPRPGEVHGLVAGRLGPPIERDEYH
jgi:selT/selW/selH-like putative selenoprotein